MKSEKLYFYVWFETYLCKYRADWTSHRIDRCHKSLGHMLMGSFSFLLSLLLGIFKNKNSIKRKLKFCFKKSCGRLWVHILTLPLVCSLQLQICQVFFLTFYFKKQCEIIIRNTKKKIPIVPTAISHYFETQ